MAEGETNKYATNGDQSDSLPAFRPVEAQPVGNTPTSVLNSQPGQQDMLCYEQQYSGDRKSLIPHAQPLSGYAPHTQPPPGYAPHTQPVPGYVQPAYSAQPPANGYVTGRQVKDTSSTCWLVVGILTAILCCLPLGVAGAVMAYLSGEDARRGNAAAYKTKICQSKALTLTGLGIGLLAIIAIVCAIFVKSGSAFSGTQSSDAIYLGCFEDNILRDLDGDDYDFGDNLSVENCNTYCYDRGYKYAGLKSGYHCSCGTSYGSYGELDQDECSSVCSADGLECGGLYSNSVYRTNYIGCYRDHQDYEKFDHYVDLPDYKVTPNNCVKRCKTDGFQYAAIWNGKSCYCGDQYNIVGKVSRDVCDGRCPSNSRFSCGGISLKSVYNTFN